MSERRDISFPCMGTEIRLLVEGAGGSEARGYLEGFDRRLSRFSEDSELSRLNRGPRRVVPASQLLRAAVSAGVWAADRSGGLVDPTLLGPRAARGLLCRWGGLLHHEHGSSEPVALNPARAAA